MRKIGKKILVCCLSVLLVATVLTTLGVASEQKHEIMPVESDRPALSVSDYYVDPDTSFVTLTRENFDGLTTCPIGDGPEYHFLKVTVMDEYGVPLPGIKADDFDFDLTPVGSIFVHGELSCSFIAFGPTLSVDAPVVTNQNGEILFAIIGDTTIIGDIDIEVVVLDTPLNDVDTLSCKSFDIDHDGDVDCEDFDIFASDYNGESGEIWRSDFNWDGVVNLIDLVMFAEHVEGPCVQNQPPLVPYDPDPADGSIDVALDTDFSWSSGDVNRIDTVTYTIYIGSDVSQLEAHDAGSYSGNVFRITWTPDELLDSETTYYWMVNASDDNGGSSESPLWTFTTRALPQGNNPPHMPTNPSPADGAVNVEMSTAVINWYGGDPDVGDQVTYSIYFGTESTPPFWGTTGPWDWDQTGPFTSNLGILLDLGTTYFWRINAEDSHGAVTQGPVWSFTTKREQEVPSNGGGGIPRRTRTAPNQLPIADLSAGEPYEGVVRSEMVFDASLSYDPDGAITAYIWDFGDGSSGFGEITTHSYVSEGTYLVTLTVIDNRNAKSTDSTLVVIRQAKNPPSIPEIISLTGSTRVHINKISMYMIQSTDENNDMLQYSVNWGDGTSDQSFFIISGTPYVVGHLWTTPGTYEVSISATDGKLVSSASITVVAEEQDTGVPVENIALIVLAILALLLFFLFLIVYKKRKKNTNKKK